MKQHDSALDDFAVVGRETGRAAIEVAVLEALLEQTKDSTDDLFFESFPLL